jgi:hypothetical protein
MKRVLLAIVLIGLPMFANSAVGCLCSITPNQTPEQIKEERLKAYKNADAVFSGRVIEINRWEAKFKVEKIWKGDSIDEIKMLMHGKNQKGEYVTSSCDFTFRFDESYLVYAYKTTDGLKTHACSRSSLLRYAEQEMKGLDEIKLPVIKNVNTGLFLLP